MISFIIPSYNYDCTALVFALHQQALKLKSELANSFDFEIIVGDDCSTDADIILRNSQIESLEGCRYLRLTKNIGRAHICNLLVEQVKFDYFVLIDCDALICTDDFVAQYWANRDCADVVCGALKNPEICPAGGELRYVYEKAAEGCRTVEFRNAHPYTYFTTFNVLFHRSVFSKLQFDDRCTEYGYEDALMGLMLEKRGYKVAHIENPLIHNGIDPSAVYLSKIETSLRVLYKLGEPLHSASALIQLKRKLATRGLLPVVSFFYRTFYTLFRKQLLSRHPSMSLLKFYKLGYYVELERNHSVTRYQH